MTDGEETPIGISAGSLGEHLVAEGNWLFRYRSYLPIVLIVPLTLAMTQVHYLFGSHSSQHVWTAGCFTCSLIGLLICCAVVGSVPAGTSGRNTRRQIAEELNTTGWYSVVRNPLYFANFIIWTGVVAYPRNATLMLMFVSTYWLYYERIIAAEELFLFQRFGKRYDAWRRKTPIFVPRFGSWQAAELPFQFRSVLRREYPGFFAVALAFFLLDTTAHWFVDHRIYVDPSWAVLAGTGAVTFFVFRFLKRHTEVLDLSGR